MKSKIVLSIALVAVLIAAFLYVHLTSDQQSVFTGPKELSDAFVDALFDDPSLAFSMMEKEYQKSNGLEKFQLSISMILPRKNEVKSIEYVSKETGWEETRPDGAKFPSISFCYRLVKIEENTPDSELGVDVVEKDGRYFVSRYTVRTLFGEQ